MINGTTTTILPRSAELPQLFPALSRCFQRFIRAYTASSAASRAQGTSGCCLYYVAGSTECLLWLQGMARCFAEVGEAFVGNVVQAIPEVERTLLFAPPSLPGTTAEWQASPLRLATDQNSEDQMKMSVALGGDGKATRDCSVSP